VGEGFEQGGVDGGGDGLVDALVGGGDGAGEEGVGGGGGEGEGQFVLVVDGSAAGGAADDGVAGLVGG
jgi:hypothetical protein